MALPVFKKKTIKEIYGTRAELQAYLLADQFGITTDTNEYVWKDHAGIFHTNVQGMTGAGIQGIQGQTGLQGPSGAQGIQGQTGIQGPSGAQGTCGGQGQQGETGIQGLSGAPGIQGQTGIQGIISAGTSGYHIYYNGTNWVNSPLYTDATNVGLGTLVSIWDAGYRALQIGKSTALVGFLPASITWMTNNVRGSCATRLDTGYAQMLMLDNLGKVLIGTAVSGVAGSGISWTYPMQIANTGEIGIAQSPGTEKLEVTGNIQLQRTSVDANGNYLKVLKSRAGGAGWNNDVIGGVQFDSYDTASSKITYGQVIGRIGSASSGSPKGEIGICNTSSGYPIETLTIKRSTGTSAGGAVIDVIATGTNLQCTNDMQLTPSGDSVFIDGGLHIGDVLGGTAPGDNNLIVDGKVDIAMTGGTGRLNIANKSDGPELLIGYNISSYIPDAWTCVAVGNSASNSVIRIGQAYDACGELTWNYNATPSNAYFEIKSRGADTLHLQSSSGRVDINTNNPGGSGTRLTVGGDTQVQRVTINDANGTYFKVLKSRNGAAGQDNDVIGGVQFDSYDTIPTKITYGQIIGRIGSASSGSPKGEIGMLLQTTTGLYETLTLKRSTGQSTEGVVIDVIETYTNILCHNDLQLTPSGDDVFVDGGLHVGGVYGDTAPGDNNLIVDGTITTASELIGKNICTGTINSLADNGVIDLYTVLSGWASLLTPSGTIIVSLNGTWYGSGGSGIYCVDGNGNVGVIYSCASLWVNTDTINNKFCLYNDGTRYVFKNRIGGIASFSVAFFGYKGV